MKEISKSNYISKAYQILEEDGIEAISIRRLAVELGCNSANLYRYFDGLNELILYASLKYLKEYTGEVQAIFSSVKDSLSLHFAVWECFARYTFSYPEIFNNLFWGEYSGQLETVIKDYYTLFPEELAGADPYLRDIMLSGDFDYRDYLMVMRSVEDGTFTTQQAKFLNMACMNIYRGFLKNLLDHPDSRDPAAAKNAFIDCLKTLFALTAAAPEHISFANFA